MGTRTPTLEEFVGAAQLKLAMTYNALQSKTIRSAAPGEHREEMEAVRDAMKAIRMLEIRLKKVHAYSSMDESKAS